MAFCCCGAGTASSVTSKHANQLQHLESMGILRGPSPRLRRTEVQVPVILNVYSLLESNKKLSKMGMGVYHSGVVVYGIEWGYGEVVENPNASGLFCVHPGQAAGRLYRTIRIGYTTRSPMQVDTILHRLENEWRSCEYHILHHNCNHFAQAFCDLLSTTEKLQVPAWCNRAARVGDRIIPRKLATKVQHMIDDEPPKAVAPSMLCNINEMPLSVVPREWYLHPSIFQPMRYVCNSRPESMLSRDHVPPATTASHNGNGNGNGGGNGGGSSHYTVEYDILPPPGYEPPDAGTPYPPVKRREIYLATDENGSISHMTAIEEQPSVTRASRAESSSKSMWSHHTVKHTSDHSPAPSLHGGTAAVHARQSSAVVLPPVQASANSAQTVTPSGSPQASTLDSETESGLRSDGSDEFPPCNVPRPEVSTSATGATAAVVSSASAAAAHVGKEASRPANKSSSSLHREGLFEKPLYTMRETSVRSGGVKRSLVSYGAGHGEQQRPPIARLRTAQPVGCITALLSAPITPVAVETAENPTEKEEEKRPNTVKNDAHTIGTPSETSLSVSGGAASTVEGRKHKLESDSKTQRPKEKEKKKATSSRQTSTKQLNDFSDLVAVPDTPSTGSSNSSVTATDSKKKPAWMLLFKDHGTGSASNRKKRGKKYLSSPPLSDAASHTNNDSHDVDTASILTPLMSPAMQPQHRSPLPLQQQLNHQSLNTSTSTMNVAGGCTDMAVSMPAAELVLETKVDGTGPVREATAVYVPGSPKFSPSPQPVSCVANKESAFSSLAKSHNGNGEPLTATEGRRSPCVNSPKTPRHNRRMSNSSSASESHQQPLLWRLSQSAVLPDVPEQIDSPVRRNQNFTITPERAIVSATSGVGTTGTSPTAALRPAQHSSASALSDTTTPTPMPTPPLPPHAERSRTPIPNSRKRFARNGEHTFDNLVLDLDGGDTMEPPVQRTSMLSNSSQLFSGVAPRRSTSRKGAGEMATSLSPDRVAHTPMAPFPRRPSLLSRERTFAANGKTNRPTPDNGRSADAVQKNLTVELKELSLKSLTLGDSRGTLDES